MIRQHARLRMPVDTTLFAVTMALIVIGLWMVFDSSYPKALDNLRMGNDAFYFLKAEAVGAIAGLFALFGFMRYAIGISAAMAVTLMLAGIALLFAVYLPHIGVHENNAARWLKIRASDISGIEVAKLSLIIYAAAILSRPNCNVRELTEKGIDTPARRGRDLYSADRARTRSGNCLRAVSGLSDTVVSGGSAQRHLRDDCGNVRGFRVSGRVRVRGIEATVWQVTCTPKKFKQGIGYQVYHAELATGSGQLDGHGLGQGTGKILSAQGNSDFIFATNAEELGFVGSVVLLCLQCAVSWRGFLIAQQTKTVSARS